MYDIKSISLSNGEYGKPIYSYDSLIYLAPTPYWLILMCVFGLVNGHPWFRFKSRSCAPVLNAAASL